MVDMQGGETWYFEQLQEQPQSGFVFDWEMYSDGRSFIRYMMGDGTDIIGNGDISAAAEQLNSLGISAAARIPESDFNVSFTRSYPPQVISFYHVLTDAEAMFLCALKEKKKGQTVFDYFDEVRQLGAFAIDNPDKVKELELLKNPFRDVELMTPAIASFAPEIFEQLGYYEEAVGAVAKFRDAKQRLASFERGKTPRAEVDALVSLLKQIDDELERLSLEIRFAQRHDSSRVTMPENDLRNVELVTGLPVSEHRLDWKKMKLAGMKPDQLARAEIVLGFNSNYATEIGKMRATGFRGSRQRQPFTRF